MTEERERSKRRHTRLAHAVRDGDDKLADKLRREIDAAPSLPGLSEEMLASIARGPTHTCCPACRQ